MVRCVFIFDVIMIDGFCFDWFYVKVIWMVKLINRDILGIGFIVRVGGIIKYWLLMLILLDMNGLLVCIMFLYYVMFV